MEESKKNFEQELRAFENSPKGTLGRQIYEEVTKYVNEQNRDKKMMIGNLQAAKSFVWEEVWRLTRLADEEEKIAKASKETLHAMMGREV